MLRASNKLSFSQLLRSCRLAAEGFRGCSADIHACAAGTIARAVQPPVHDVTDASVLRSWLNSPLGASLEADIFKARGTAQHRGHCKENQRRPCSACRLMLLSAKMRSCKLVQIGTSGGGCTADARARSQATNVIRTFAKAHMMSPDRAIPAAVLREAAGFAILTVMKARLRCVHQQ